MAASTLRLLRTEVQFICDRAAFQRAKDPREGFPVCFQLAGLVRSQWDMLEAAADDFEPYALAAHLASGQPAIQFRAADVQPSREKYFRVVARSFTGIAGHAFLPGAVVAD